MESSMEPVLLPMCLAWQMDAMKGIPGVPTRIQTWTQFQHTSKAYQTYKSTSNILEAINILYSTKKHSHSAMSFGFDSRYVFILTTSELNSCSAKSSMLDIFSTYYETLSILRFNSGYLQSQQSFSKKQGAFSRINIIRIRQQTRLHVYNSRS